MSRIRTEVCIESVAGALAARDGGADRLELCSNLASGGLTPSVGLARTVREAVDLPVFAMLRPRSGDFCYDSHELEQIRRDQEALAPFVDGYVVGLLAPDGVPDLEGLKPIVDGSNAAVAKPVTFHRAFDWCVDPHAALESIVAAGCARILSSGLAASAPDGAELLGALAARAGDRIVVMPGAGVRASNVAELLERTGAREVHFSASGSSPARSRHRNPACPMGSTSEDDAVYRTTDRDQVAAIVRAVREFEAGQRLS